MGDVEAWRRLLRWAPPPALPVEVRRLSPRDHGLEALDSGKSPPVPARLPAGGLVVARLLVWGSCCVEIWRRKRAPNVGAVVAATTPGGGEVGSTRRRERGETPDDSCCVTTTLVRTATLE